MPDADSENVWRSGRPLTVLFWSGVGLAPLAGLLLLIGGGQGSLRVAGVLAVLAVVLIGLAIALRPDVGTVRLQLEETLLAEIDTLREEVRDDIANAARATHQSFGERVGALQQQVEALRTERGAPPAAVPPGAARAAAAAPVAPPPAARGQSAPPPPAPRPPVALPQSVAPPYSATARSAAPRSAAPRSAAPRSAAPRSAAPRSAVPRSAAPRSAVPPPSPPVSATPVGRRQAPPVSIPAANGRTNGGQQHGGRRAARHQADGAQRPSSGRANVPSGVYRRTETVHVTRSTSYVDEHAPGNGRLYEDGGYHGRHDDRGQDWSPPPPPPPRRAAAEPLEESWTDQKLRERYGRRPRPYDSDGDEPWNRDGDRWQPISAEPISPQPMSGQPLSPQPVSAEPRGRRSHLWEEDSAGLRIGERWAAVRDDDRGRELTLGERRAARHSDDGGSEVRIEDRWASVRREDRGRENGGRHSTGRGDYDRDVEGRGDYGRHTNGRGFGRPDYDRPALPAASSEPSWNDSWDEPVRESRGHRYRSDDDAGDRGYGGGSPRRRRLDFELSDERWG